MKRGVTLDVIAACCWGPGGLKMERTAVDKLCFDGASHLVVTNSVRRRTCAESRAREKPLERKTSSPTKRQFTVHLKRKALEKSKARER